MRGTFSNILKLEKHFLKNNKKWKMLDLVRKKEILVNKLKVLGILNIVNEDDIHSFIT